MLTVLRDVFIESSLEAVARDMLAHADETKQPGDFALAAAKMHDFLQKYPFAVDYDEDEWYLAYAYYGANEFGEAARQYQQVLKNPHS